ncbi:MAG: hypothetical protein Q8R12_00545 [bacterium]|nr:hypothetical protein [bacterium]
MKAELFWTDGKIPASVVAEKIAPEIEKIFGKVHSETADKFFESEDCRLHHGVYVFCEDRLETALRATLYLQRATAKKCRIYGDRYINDCRVDTIILSFEKAIRRSIEGLKKTRNILPFRDSRFAAIRRILQNSLNEISPDVTTLAKCALHNSCVGADES